MFAKKDGASPTKESDSLLPGVNMATIASSNTTLIKTGVLVCLTLQNAAHALLTRYSQGILKESYSSTEVVLVAELLKMIVSGYLAMTDKSDSDAQGTGLSKLIWLSWNSRKIIVLVVLYSIANLLAFYALNRVEASVYTVTLQLKIVTTAIFAILILGRFINYTKWRALILLVGGCILVASPAFNKPPVCNNDKDIPPSSDKDVSVFESTFGVGAILVMITISGYSAIYFESMLKKSNERITIWERNFQLALYSIVFLILVVVFETVSEGENVQDMVPTLFEGWTMHAVCIAILQAGGGLLVAATLKYADAILKTLATSGAIVLSAIMNWMLLGGTLDIFVGIGCVCTILAIFNYTNAPMDSPKEESK